jgi:C1A family cysteine protease
MMATQRKYTWQPQPADSRDYKFSLPLMATTLPDHVDPLGTSNKVEDQGNLGSCTGHASTTALEIVTGNKQQYSRLMAYYNGRLVEGNTRYDDGAYLRDVIKGLKTYGVSYESLWPYIETKFAAKPSAAAYSNAMLAKNLVAKYEAVTTLDQMKTAIAAGLPVVFGFMVTNQIETAAVAKSGYLRYPTGTDYIVGGHAVAAIGYDMRGTEPFMWVRNSWGNSWGINGNFKMPFKWFTSSYVSDMWVIYSKSTTAIKVKS